MKFKTYYKNKIIVNLFFYIPHSVVGGNTQSNRDIWMNPEHDNLMNWIHEIFHTFFYDNDNANSGIGKYGTPEMPNQTDIDDFFYNPELPKYYKWLNFTYNTVYMRLLIT